jgi:NADH dehydrogenase
MLKVEKKLQKTPNKVAANVKDKDDPPKTGPVKVLVVGAGFGGLNVMKTLAGKEGVEVELLDRNNYHGFWPLLYQVATGALLPGSIAYSLREITSHHKNLSFRLTEVQEVDLARKTLKTDTGDIGYDFLVLAAGSANNYFGSESIPDNSYSLKDVDEALNLRESILSSLERAAVETDPEQRRFLLTFAVVGAGPTGVELAGMLAEVLVPLVRKEYPGLDSGEIRLMLVEAHTNLLEIFPKSLQKVAQKHLEKKGVEILQNSPVTAVENGTFTFKDGRTLRANTIIWAAGVTAAPLGQSLGLKLAHSDRVPVEPTLNLKVHPEVFVIGDMAYLEGYKGQEAYPMVAPVAIQQARVAASNILAAIREQHLKKFHYFDKGNMATIGRKDAVVDAFGVKLHGQLAWLTWLLVHLYFLVGFRTRVLVFSSWAYNYFTYNLGTRFLGGKRHQGRKEIITF